MNRSYDERVRALLEGKRARRLRTDLGEVILRYESFPKDGAANVFFCVSLKQKAQLSDISWRFNVSDLTDALKYVRAERVTNYYLDLNGAIDEGKSRSTSFVAPKSFHGPHPWHIRREPEVTLDEILDACEREVQG